MTHVLSDSNSPATRTPSPPGDLVPGEGSDANDTDSLSQSDTSSSTASVSASILEYRRIHGRTYHSDKFRNDYVFPNDDQQLQSVDISHHYLTLLLNGELFLAPVKEDVQRVLDVGTGSGIWAIDFGDQFPSAEVIGTDLSPCQPQWVPPNVRFEVDDATESWTWNDNHFDFIHLRYLFGAIPDWNHIFDQAYRCCAPGGWIESVEADVRIRSDDGTADLAPVWKTCDKMYEEGGKVLNRSFFVSELQEEGIKKAGFVDVKVVDYKIPIGGWPKDPKLAEIGRFVQQTLENDLEGYSFVLWNHVLKWPDDEYQIFLMQIRQALRNRKVHSYIMTRYVYGRKPE
ncbi:S-adenosyl-L-methionine-dependent methyltransferase [Fusarium flagelliforme]|uniref:Demethylmenaquinone methyltransferase n=1 Tax=Fusarium flagelliforme TaxID=2675880 RepID=A0A395MVD0_9HYPO|nr:S-adenosyl-L-methionine-dependent methyltransferase [Fusarium flagelliforme]KAH7179986.1 S-adenosyl-L-methionine-dependent methyltransferase [Fusarium flagelliforme]RFN51876.1 hypothetical protein FIE12Z_3837 [Fusarium flagelliforme]